MDFIKAVSIIRKDLDEVSALLDQLSVTPGCTCCRDRAGTIKSAQCNGNAEAASATE